MIRTMFGKVLILVIAVLIISFTLTGVIMNAGLIEWQTKRFSSLSSFREGYKCSGYVA